MPKLKATNKTAKTNVVNKKIQTLLNCINKDYATLTKAYSKNVASLKKSIAATSNEIKKVTKKPTKTKFAKGRAVNTDTKTVVQLKNQLQQLKEEYASLNMGEKKFKAQQKALSQFEKDWAKKAKFAKKKKTHKKVRSVKPTNEGANDFRFEADSN